MPDLTNVRARDKKSKARQKRNHDARHGARDLTPLQPGDSVWIPQRQNMGKSERKWHHIPTEWR